MLSNLNIENIAVIEKADIDFNAGLNVLTGETGAGKSILVDAINAVLGERTSRELVRHGAENALVTATFENVEHGVLQKAAELGIPAEDDTLIISRRISAQGKTACRINGAPCTVSMVRELGDMLVNIHGQHDSQQLLNPDYHYRFLDMTGSDGSYLDNYRTAFHHLVAIRRRLKSLTADADTKDRRLELLDYQIKELTEADVKPGEKEALTSRLSAVTNARTIMDVLHRTVNALNGDDDTEGVSGVLASLQHDVQGIQSMFSASGALNTALDTALDACEKVKDVAETSLAEIDFAPDEAERIEQRLDLLYRLFSKYGDSEEALLAYLENAIKERDSIVNSDEEIERLSGEYDAAYDATIKAAEALSDYRCHLARQLERDVKEQLIFLDMPKIRFVVSFEKGRLSSTGYDTVEFLISTNPGEPPKPLAKIASGGELSRIMLAIKNIIAKNDSVGTLIFDEIDTGVSGRASRKIGLKLKAVSAHTQVICVTHSAQIASAADTHLLIAKEYQNGRTFTNVTPLGFDERKQELARIMGGLTVTEALLQSAEEMLREAQTEPE